MSALVHHGKRPEDDIEGLRVRLTEREALLHARHAEVSQLRIDLAAFRLRYRRDVGLLHEELDDLEHAIAEAELGEISRRLGQEAPEQTASAQARAPQSAPRFSSDAVRRLFRDVAKAIHPDLAADAHTRDRRHTLMVEANRAYALGDEERLRRILHAWEKSPEAVAGDDQEAARERLVRRIEETDDQLAALDAELIEIKESPLAKLMTMVDEASAQGKDLVADMVRRLKRDIMRAKNRLDAMRWNG